MTNIKYKEMMKHKSLEHYSLTEELKKVKSLYDKFNFTIKSDNELFFKYLDVYENITDDMSVFQFKSVIRFNKINYETLSRCGRKLREMYPEIYYRDTKEKEQCFKEFFGR